MQGRRRCRLCRRRPQRQRIETEPSEVIMASRSGAGLRSAIASPSIRCARIDAGAGRSYVSAGRSRTMFSMPLAYPSTLDRRPSVAQPERSTSYVEEFWSPSLGRRRENRRLKHTLHFSDLSSAERRGSFSLRRGLDSRLTFLQAEHHLWFRRCLPPPNERRRPVGSPSTGLVCG